MDTRSSTRINLDRKEDNTRQYTYFMVMIALRPLDINWSLQFMRRVMI